MVADVPDLWTLARLQAQIDPGDLARAVLRQIRVQDLDYRSRLLIRDSVDALKSHWDRGRFDAWLDDSSLRSEIERICGESFDEVGFPSIRKRIMERTTPEQIRDFLETLGWRIGAETTVYVAGSCALILPGYLVRGTDDVDVVDEVPKPIREEHALLDELERGFSLHMGHVQGHYFPAGWRDRAKPFGVFGKLSVFVLDVYDIGLSKLFSARIKDLTDLRDLVPVLDKEILTRRLRESCGEFLADDRLAELARGNWRVLYKEDLPT